MRATCLKAVLKPAVLSFPFALSVMLVGPSGHARAEETSLSIAPAIADPADWSWSPAWSDLDIETSVAEAEAPAPYFINGGRPVVAAPATAVQTRVSRTDNRDGSSSLTAAGKLGGWSGAEVGIDVSLAARQNAGPPAPPSSGVAQDGSGAAAWAHAPVPGVSRVSIWQQASVDVRIDPLEERGRVGTTFSREWRVTDSLSARVTDSYGLVTSASGTEQWETGKAMSVDVKPTQTSFSVGASSQSGETGWQPSVSATQKLFGPLTVTTSFAGTGDGLNRSVTAGFRHTW